MTQTAYESAPALRLEDAGISAKKISRWMLLVLAIVSALVYANTLRNGFALDDMAIVKGNPKVLSLEWTAIWNSNYWPDQDGAPPDVLYRPLTIWSYLATQAVAPGAAWAFHLGNILLHALVTVMATVLAWRVFGNRAVAILAGLFFALHPIHTEVVANVVGRAELLSTVFSLAALLVFLPETPLLLERTPAKRSIWHGWLVAACFFAAILSKETPAALLMGFVFIDVWRWSHWDKTSRPTLLRWMTRQTLCYYTPMAIVFGIYIAIRINACGLMQDIRAIHPIVNPLVTATMPERIVTPFVILTKYLGLMFWPSVLSADYSFPSLLPTSNPLQPGALIGILVTVLSLLVMVRAWKKAPHVVLTLALFACSYALASNFLRIGTIMGERLFYLPSLFVLMIVAWAICQAYEAAKRKASMAMLKHATIGLTAAICIAMTIRTYVRNKDWNDNVPLALATAQGNLQSAKACFWAGFVLCSEGPEPWMREFGSVLLKRSIELSPGWGRAYFELAKYEGRNQHLGKSLILLSQAAERSPGVNDIRVSLIGVKIDLKNQPAENYMPELIQNRNEHPKDASAELALAVAYAAQGKWDLGEKACEAAVKLNPRFSEAICELGHLRLASGQLEPGVFALHQYVSHVANNYETRCTLAEALMQLDQHKHPGALAEATKLLEQAEHIQHGEARVRELRAELVRRRAGLPVPAHTPEVQVPAVSMGPTGGQQ